MPNCQNSKFPGIFKQIYKICKEIFVFESKFSNFLKKCQICQNILYLIKEIYISKISNFEEKVKLKKIFFL